MIFVVFQDIAAFFLSPAASKTTCISFSCSNMTVYGLATVFWRSTRADCKFNRNPDTNWCKCGRVTLIFQNASKVDQLLDHESYVRIVARSFDRASEFVFSLGIYSFQASCRNWIQATFPHKFQPIPLL